MIGGTDATGSVQEEERDRKVFAGFQAERIISNSLLSAKQSTHLDFFQLAEKGKNREGSAPSFARYLYQLRYYGWYSNKKRGMRKAEVEGIPADHPESLTEYQLKRRLTWAALIKCVCEVDPRKCPSCGAQMKIVGFIERDNHSLIKLLLSAAGLCRKPAPRPPPPEPAAEVPEVILDCDFFAQNCI